MAEKITTGTSLANTLSGYIGADTLRPERVAYIGFPIEGPYKAAYYRYQKGLPC